MRFRKLLFRLILFMLIIASLIAGAWFLPLFQIQRMEVVGTSVLSQEEVWAASGLQVGMNAFRELRPNRSLFRLGMPVRENALNAVPYIKSAVVRFRPPGDVLIQITERAPAAYISWIGNYLLVDEHGVVLEVRIEKPDESLMEVRGVTFDQYSLGEPLTVDQPELLEAALRIMRAIKESDAVSEFNMWNETNWIDMVNENRAVLSLQGRLAIRFDPAGDLQYTMDFAKEIFFRHIQPEESGMIDFTKGGSPSFIPD